MLYDDQIMNRLRVFTRYLPYFLLIFFIVAYSTLSIIRHNNYQSYGFDLGINDQTVWRYSQLQRPLSTIDPNPDKTKLYDHVELIYAVIAPFYWIWANRRMLLALQAVFACSGGLAMYFLAKRKKFNELLSLAIMIGYLGFYGVQFALWTDAHSIAFGAGLLAWFIYFLDVDSLWGTILFFLLSITAKENIGLLTGAVSLIYFIKRKNKLSLFLTLGSALYIWFIFYVYFPHIIHFTYMYQNDAGLLSNLNPFYLFNTPEKIQSLYYTALSFGFLPILMPFYLLPAVLDYATYFVVASDLVGAQGIFGQYRIALAPLLAWGTIKTIVRFKWLNSKYTAVYLLLCTMLVQYMLHLPLSYLSKSWFWAQPAAVKSIDFIKYHVLPTDASVVAQNNIIPHISERNQIYELYPEKKDFPVNSPCGQLTCNWFRWYGQPHFLYLDTAPDWDIRHLLANRGDFLDGLKNLEKAGVVTKYKQVGTTILYTVNRNPDIKQPVSPE